MSLLPSYWPALCIGLTVAAYWGRVLRLVQKSYKKTGRAANFWPAEPLGRTLRILWIPSVILWIVVPLVIAFVRASRGPLRLLPIPQWLAWIAVAVAFSALVATIICWKKMGKSWRMGIDPGEKTQLIVTGPYAYVRHPIYALSQVLMIASVLAVPSMAMIVIGLVHLTFLQWEARREERYLVATHGDDYENYLRRVGRFIPKSISGYHGTS